MALSKRLFLVLLTLPLAGCFGYHFPGSPSARLPEDLQGAVARIAGPGATAHPRLARQLQERIINRLGLPWSRSDGNNLILTIHMEPLQRDLRLENQAGRADHYRVTASAHAALAQPGAAPSKTWPSVRGSATYYELNVATANQVAREQAENEAMDQLADALVAMLSTRLNASEPATP
ncbi:LPS assembly lipoprotein LptE [Magnetofaba australis]|uniref:LPS-assembly lipoprotein n=1 Tax=Magnetofaba australis IT-1 TaxID=1434232 RepID=A0A1Y2JZ42_9PROT|nr:LPS assembly lipoprotein LptE [Magnetofaba australis]OSM00139.1 hypothetical protein MAIT1_00573 [Magnetofaba australis IT-1]